VLGLACWGCPATRHTTTNEDTELTESDFLGELVQASCRGLGECCTRSGLPFSKSRCEYAVRTAIIQQGIPRSSDIVTYDADAATACVAEVEALMQSCVDWQSSPPLSCAAAFSGSSPPSGVCLKEDDCAVPDGGAATCMVDATQRASCTVRSRGTLSASCTSSCWLMGGVLQCEPAVDPYLASTTICSAEDGLFCNASGSCARLLGRGESCRSSRDCQGGLYCEASRGVCLVRVMVGNTCAQADACAVGARCSAAGRCALGQPDGAACDATRVCQGTCDMTGICQGAAVSGLLAPFAPTAPLCSPEIPDGALGGT
jgi:hypothetical protein